jgi:hypothetical protein
MCRWYGDLRFGARCMQSGIPSPCQGHEDHQPTYICGRRLPHDVAGRSYGERSLLLQPSGAEGRGGLNAIGGRPHADLPGRRVAARWEADGMSCWRRLASRVMMLWRGFNVEPHERSHKMPCDFRTITSVFDLPTDGDIDIDLEFPAPGVNAGRRAILMYRHGSCRS